MSNADAKVETAPEQAETGKKKPSYTDRLKHENEQLREQLASVKADLEFEQKANRVLQEDLTSVRGERNELKSRVEALEKKVAEFKIDEAAIEKKYRDKVKKEVEALERRTHDAERHLKANQKMQQMAKAPDALRAAQELAAERLQHIVDLEKELAKYV